jgi:hypothetical protein
VDHAGVLGGNVLIVEIKYRGKHKLNTRERSVLGSLKDLCGNTGTTPQSLGISSNAVRVAAG